MDISNCKFIVRRNGVNYKCAGEDLADKLNINDKLVLKQDGTLSTWANDGSNPPLGVKDSALFVVTGSDGNNYKVTGAQFKNLIDPLDPLIPPNADPYLEWLGRCIDAKVECMHNDFSGGEEPYTYTYQWWQKDTSWDDPYELPGETQKTHLTDMLDEFKYVACQVTCTDANGATETIQSDWLQLTFNSLNVIGIRDVDVVGHPGAIARDKTYVGDILKFDPNEKVTEVKCGIPPYELSVQWRIQFWGEYDWSDIPGETNVTHEVLRFYDIGNGSENASRARLRCDVWVKETNGWRPGVEFDSDASALIDTSTRP